MAAQSRGDLPGADGRLLRLSEPRLRGDDVAELQRGLAALGYTGASGHPLVADGIYGPDTDRAARALQERGGLEPNGLVGPKTKAALARLLGEGTATPPPEQTRPASAGREWPGRHLRLETPYLRGEDVRTFQSRLVELGYRGAGGAALSTDGVWGPQTDAAARAFIRDAGLPSIWIVGPRTWAAAFRA